MGCCFMIDEKRKYWEKYPEIPTRIEDRSRKIDCADDISVEMPKENMDIFSKSQKIIRTQIKGSK